MSFTPAALGQVLAGFPACRRLLVAYSGGMDSHALLHALVALRAGGLALGGALHVNHGLSPQAAAWAEHCLRTCAALGVDCEVLRVDARAGPGHSPEARARELRYRALAGRLAPSDCLLTAHHRDDQAETLLLQLLRGAGPAGIAAMPCLRPLGAGLLGRPLLDFSRAELRAYAEAQGLQWVEDDSNLELALDRNFLRHQVLPVLETRWPGAAATLARAAVHCREAATLIGELGTVDLAVARGPSTDCLRLAALAALAPARRRNLLRVWLRTLGVSAPPARTLGAACSQLLDAAGDRSPRVAWAGVELRRYRDLVYCLPVRTPVDPAWTGEWRLEEPLALPGGGQLRAVPVLGCGLRAAALPGLPRLLVRFRRGGEHCHPAGRRHSRDLKRWFQAQGVPPWERDRMPLLYLGAALVAIADCWLCEPYAAAPGEPGYRIEWQRVGGVTGLDGAPAAGPGEAGRVVDEGPIW